MTTSTTTENVGLNAPSSRRGIVVGVDGSPGSNHAIAWAAERVGRFGNLRPVSAWRYPTWAVSDPMFGTLPPPPAEEFAEGARLRAEESISSIPSEIRHPVVLAKSPAGPALVEAGADAELIVVGTRGRGAIADGILGSVSCHVVHHATVPVAIVPADARIADSHRRIVVGIDGSDNSINALAWAIENSDASVAVEAVHAWSYQPTMLPEAYVEPVNYSEIEARQTLQRVVDEVERRLGHNREVVQTLEYGDPRSLLRDLSEKADLLVLGARGHQGVAHLLLGSVTSGLIHRPLVATVVVPSPAD